MTMPHYLQRFVIMSVGISVDRQSIADYCQRWRIAELAMFGSVLREDFRADSGVD